MTATRFFLAGAAALILTGSAATAFAQAKPHAVTPDFGVKNDFTSAAAGVQYPQDEKRALRWDAKKGRWGLKLDLDQPSSRDMELQDVQELTNFFERRVSAYQVGVQGEVAFDMNF